MHELGIVFHTIDILEDVVREHDLERITRVTLELGEVSGIVTEFFQDAWRWAADKRDWLAGAELNIVQIDAVTVCNACGRTYPTVEFGRMCPHCGSPKTELLRGNELNIRDVECY